MHRGIVQLIRRAQRFLYIENQYFIGSCHEWSTCNDVGGWNLIPLEIAQRIVSKIIKGEPFTAYVVIPLIPEGDLSYKIIR